MNSFRPANKAPLPASAPIEELTLIPYGCTNLRITEFPVIDPGNSE